MKWMPIRAFLRGGYQDLTEPTVVTSHGHPVFTVMPAAKADEWTRFTSDVNPGAEAIMAATDAGVPFEEIGEEVTE